MRRLPGLLLAIAAIGVGLACGGHSAAVAPAGTPGSSPPPAAAATPAPTPTPSPLVPARPPSRMAIPSLGIEAAVENVPFLGVPSDPAHVAWFQNGPAPGEAGDAVFDGHLDWTTGPAVFWRLREIRPGATIQVTGENGATLTFLVDRVDVVDAASTPPDWLYTSAGAPALSLITCEGVYRRSTGYSERLLVHAVLAPRPASA